MGTLGRAGDPADPEAVLSANVVAACLAGEVLLTLSWLPGRDPLLQYVSGRDGAAAPVPRRRRCRDCHERAAGRRAR